MSVASAWSDAPDSAVAFAAAYGRLCERLMAPPDFLVVSHAEGHDPAALASAADALPAEVRVIGTSTSHGLMTEEGVFLGPTVLGMLGIRSEGGRFGTDFRDKRGDPRAAAAAAVLAAIDDAGRSGELPGLVLLAATPGGEDAALAGIADVLGPKVPVVGGTAADDGHAGGKGKWSVLTRRGHGRDAVAVAVVFADFPLTSAFQGGGVPSRFSGEVTEVEGARMIRGIDGRPAAEVYASWYEMQVGRPLPRDSSARLHETAFLPLGREIGQVGGSGVYTLLHILSLRADGGLELLSDVAVGDRVVLMRGSLRSLEARPARAVESAISMQCADVCTVTGGLIAMCAGLAMALDGRLHEVQDALRVAMLGRPFLSAFTFGEQGCLLDDRAIHGNLMISVLVVGA